MQNHEWSLNDSILLHIFLKQGQLSVDLFVIPKNNNCSSGCMDLDSLMDTFLLLWNSTLLYISPVLMIPKVLYKLKQVAGCIILISPVWTNNSGSQI